MLPEGSAIGKYIVRRKIAEGGMAEIYLCAVKGPEGFEKEVVLKRIRPFFANEPGFVQMFIDEARLASQLNHANIVQIYDFDKHEDTYFLAMEYVQGRSLWEVRQRCRERMLPMAPLMTAHVAREVAKGLHFAHQLTVQGQRVGLVHRDVTPQNILLSYSGEVKLTDFGIAKGQSKHTVPGMLKGKFAYMAPEQSRGDEVDLRTDIFALGIILWEMLTGARLFDGDSDLAVVKAVQTAAIVPPSRLNPDVPTALDAIVLRALERDRTARFKTAFELERALAQFILSHSQSVDETDVRAWLARIFPSSAPEAAPEAPSLEVSISARPVAAAPRAPESNDSLLYAATRILARNREPGPPAREPTPPTPPTPKLVTPAPTPRPLRGATPPPSGVPGRNTQPIVPTVSRGPPSSRRALVPWLVGAGVAVAVLMFAFAASSRKAPEKAETPVAVLPPTPVPVALPEPLPVAEVPDTDGGGQGEAAEDKTPVEAAALALESAPEPDSEAPPTQKKTSSGLKWGTLVVRAAPWAELFIDGKQRDNVEQQARIRLKAGRHKVLLRNGARIIEQEINLRPNAEIKVELAR